MAIMGRAKYTHVTRSLEQIQRTIKLCFLKKSLSVTIQMKVTKQYLPVVPFVKLYKVVLNLLLIHVKNLSMSLLR